MPVDPACVSAVIVTRGNVDLQPIMDSLIFQDVVVWDNSREPFDAMVYGRTLALDRVRNDVVYSQDDDIIHSPENQRRILAEYEPGVMTGCMWPEWSDGARQQGIEGGYDDLVFAGSGAVYDATLPPAAASRYLARHDRDEFFMLWADCIIGILAPGKQIDVRFQERPEGNERYRMAYLPGGPALKREAIIRARQIRDGG